MTNLHRRHMSVGQQAANAQDWVRSNHHGGDRKSDQAVTLPLDPGLDSVATRRAQSGASDKTQRMADKVAKADPALAKKVAHGDVSLSNAHQEVSKKAMKEPTDADRIAANAHDDCRAGRRPEYANKNIECLEWWAAKSTSTRDARAPAHTRGTFTPSRSPDEAKLIRSVSPPRSALNAIGSRPVASDSGRIPAYRTPLLLPLGTE